MRSTRWRKTSAPIDFGESVRRPESGIGRLLDDDQGVGGEPATRPQRGECGFGEAVPVEIVPVVEGGEVVKNDIHILERMLKVFHAAGLDRRSYVVVIGGGAVLDAVGFAAAIAHRGIRLVRLPTTTLAQADAGVGVKNAVNLFGKKNWIGSLV